MADFDRLRRGWELVREFYEGRHRGALAREKRDEDDLFMLLVFSELMGIPSPASYYTLELLPILYDEFHEWHLRMGMERSPRTTSAAVDRARRLRPMSELRLDKPRIVFVGGKGGVGKTTTAGALATSWAEAGDRVLLVSTDPAHSLGDLFDRRIGPREVELLPRVWGLEIEPEEEVDVYLDSVASTMREFVRPAMYPEIERQMELSRHSPGATEAALMQRVASLMIEGTVEYDRVVFDTAPTGHTLRLLSLPEIMTAWMDGLLRSRDRSDSFGRALSRLGGGGQHRAEGEAAAAETPTSAAAESRRHDSGALDSDEPEESHARPGDELSWFQQADETPRDKQGRRIREILLERRRLFAQARRLMLDPDATAFVMVLVPEKLPILETRKALEALSEHHVPVAGLVVNRVLPESADGVFLQNRRVQEAEYLERIDRLFSRYPRVRVPLLQKDVQGVEALREIAAGLGVS